MVLRVGPIPTKCNVSNHAIGNKYLMVDCITSCLNTTIELTLSSKDSVALRAPSGLPNGKQYLQDRKRQKISENYRK